MKIKPISDLHLELDTYRLGGPEFLYSGNPDVVVLAGDTNTGDRGIKWLAMHPTETHIVYILGNHEYWRENLTSLYKKMVGTADDYRLALPNLHILDNTGLDINGVYFWGCTLWTDYNLRYNSWDRQDSEAAMNDFKRIRNRETYRKISSFDLSWRNQDSRAYLESICQRVDGKKSVIVTHHAPSAKSLTQQMIDDMGAAYASNMDDEIFGDLWIHGHTHLSVDYKIKNTRVISNPYGYGDNPQFDKDLLIEV